MRRPGLRGRLREWGWCGVVCSPAALGWPAAAAAHAAAPWLACFGLLVVVGWSSDPPGEAPARRRGYIPPPPPTHTHLLAFRCPALQFDDKLLSWSRLDFLKLADYDEVLRLVRAGVAYAQRRDAAGGFDSTLGELRKGALRRAVELPVRVVSNVVRQAVV